MSNFVSEWSSECDNMTSVWQVCVFKLWKKINTLIITLILIINWSQSIAKTRERNWYALKQANNKTVSKTRWDKWLLGNKVTRRQDNQTTWLPSNKATGKQDDQTIWLPGNKKCEKQQVEWAWPTGYANMTQVNWDAKLQRNPGADKVAREGKQTKICLPASRCSMQWSNYKMSNDSNN